MNRYRKSLVVRSGFTLLEVLVALAVLSIALAVVIQLFSANLRGIAASEDYTKASMKAESVMREILDDDKIAKKSWSETTNDGYRIDAEITPVEKERTDGLSVELLQIKLTLNWKDGTKERTLTLKTFKTVGKEI
jgi:general secretion pathway protein I